MARLRLGVAGIPYFFSSYIDTIMVLDMHAYSYDWILLISDLAFSNHSLLTTLEDCCKCLFMTLLNNVTISDYHCFSKIHACSGVFFTKKTIRLSDMATSA